MTAREQLVLRLDLFDVPDGVAPNFVLHHDDVARLPHCGVGFRGNDQPECLKIGGYLQMGAVGPVRQHLAEVLRVSLRGDGPEHIRQVLGAETSGGIEVVELGIDFRAAGFGLDSGLAVGLGKQHGAFKIDAGRAAAVADRRCAGRAEPADAQDVVNPQVPADRRMLADYEKVPASIGMWSGPTPPGGVVTEIVLPGTGVDIKGKLVLGTRGSKTALDFGPIIFKRPKKDSTFAVDLLPRKGSPSCEGEVLANANSCFPVAARANKTRQVLTAERGAQ